MRLRIGGLLAAAFLAVALVWIVADDGGEAEQEQPIEPVTGPGGPVVLHSEPPGRDGDVSRAFVDPEGERVILNGVNMFPVYPDPPRIAFSAEDYRSIRTKGFTAVRFLLPWATYEPQPRRFEHLAKLDQAVTDARRAGLYVVMLNVIVDDVNSPPAWTTGSDKIERIVRGAKAWTQTLARRYRREPAVAAYDLAAELPSVQQNRVLNAYDMMIDWVREEDANKIVITTAGLGNSDMSPARADPSRLRSRKNVVHSFHDYYAGDGDPSSVFEGYNEHGMNAGNQTWDGVGGYPDPRDDEDLAAQVQHQIRYARRARVPLWIGEYGINPEAPNADEWARQKTMLYDHHGLGRAWWLYTCGENFGLKDDSCEWRDIADELL